MRRRGFRRVPSVGVVKMVVGVMAALYNGLYKVQQEWSGGLFDH